MKNFLIILLVFFLSSHLFAQSRSTNNRQEDFDRRIEEIMRAREEMFNSILNDDSFFNFDKRFEDLIKNFDKGMGDGLSGGPIIGEYDWIETPTHQIFKLKVKQIKDRPLNIKIEKGQILLKGDVESIEEDGAKKNKRVSRVHFERSFSIPSGVDDKNPEFENKEGELLIKFKKLTASKDGHKHKNSKEKGHAPENKEQLEPVLPEGGDTII